MRSYMNMLLERDPYMLIAAQFCMWYFPESESHPSARAALHCRVLFCAFYLSLSTANTCYLFLHHMLVIEHSIVVLMMQIWNRIHKGYKHSSNTVVL